MNDRMNRIEGLVESEKIIEARINEICRTLKNLKGCGSQYHSYVQDLIGTYVDRDRIQYLLQVERSEFSREQRELKS